MTPTDRYLRTIIVDDSPDFIRAACRWTEGEPRLIVVATFDSGAAALIAVDVLRPDLVLLDVALPGMDGVEVTRRIKERPEPPAVVWITRHDPGDIAEMGRDAGADAVISKRLYESAELIVRALGARAGRSTV